MLRLSVTKNEYLMIGKDVRLTFLGSNDRSLKIMIDAPKEINIARGKAIEKRAMEQEMTADRDWFDQAVKHKKVNKPQASKAVEGAYGRGRLRIII